MQRMAIFVIAVFLFFACERSAPPPISTAGLRLWLKADAGVTLDGSTVREWMDQSGNGNDAIQLDAERQPRLLENVLNGKPVLRFDGADDRLGLTGSERMSHISLFMVLKIDSGATGPNPHYPIILGDVPGDGRVYYVLMQNEFTGYSSDTIYLGAGLNSLVFAVATDCAALGQWKSFSILTDGALWKTTLRVNNVDATMIPARNNMMMSVPLGNPGGTGAGGLGGNDVARITPGRVVAKCDIAEVIVYNVVISDSLRSCVERYLGSKYQLPYPGEQEQE
jgi:hypothetical protein